MDANDKRMDNPFADSLCSLEWIAFAMEAAKRHTERARDAAGSEDPQAAELARVHADAR